MSYRTIGDLQAVLVSTLARVFAAPEPQHALTEAGFEAALSDDHELVARLADVARSPMRGALLHALIHERSAEKALALLDYAAAKSHPIAREQWALHWLLAWWGPS